MEIVNGVESAENVDLTNIAITGGTIAGCDVTVGASKTLDVSAGTLTLAANQIAGASVAAATATTEGSIELATAAEVAAGSDTTRAVTAAGIAGTYQYETIFIPAASMVPRTTNGAAAGTSEYTTNDNTLDYYAFDDTTQEYVEFSIPMPEAWDRGAVMVKFYHSSASGSTADDTVSWGIGGVAIGNDDALDVAKTTNVQVADDVILAGTSGDLHISPSTPAFTPEGTIVLGDLINFMVYRNVGGNDNMEEDAWLFGVWIQYKKTNTVAVWT